MQFVLRSKCFLKIHAQWIISRFTNPEKNKIITIIWKFIFSFFIFSIKNINDLVHVLKYGFGCFSMYFFIYKYIKIIFYFIYLFLISIHPTILKH